jgi:hypothetical protein
MPKEEKKVAPSTRGKGRGARKAKNSDSSDQSDSDSFDEAAIKAIYGDEDQSTKPSSRAAKGDTRKVRKV